MSEVKKRLSTYKGGSLYLSGLGITDDDLVAICFYLRVKKIQITGILDLRGNDFTKLPERLFQGILVRGCLDLSNNSALQEIFPGAFFDCSIGVSLRLFGNALRKIHPRAFSGCSVREDINLSHNPALREIHPHAFSGCSVGENIYLSNNPALREIHPHAFSGCSVGENIDLSNNPALRAINPRAFFSCFIHMHLDLRRNPLLRSICPEAFAGASIDQIQRDPTILTIQLSPDTTLEAFLQKEKMTFDQAHIQHFNLRCLLICGPYGFHMRPEETAPLEAAFDRSIKKMQVCMWILQKRCNAIEHTLPTELWELIFGFLLFGTNVQLNLAAIRVFLQKIALLLPVYGVIPREELEHSRRWTLPFREALQAALQTNLDPILAAVLV